MWWKVYFVIMIGLAILTGIASFNSRIDNFNFFSLFHLIVFYLEVVGLYAFVFRKQLVNKPFWKYFFWLNVALDILILFYALYPHTLLSPLLHTFFVSEPKLGTNLLIGELLDIPSLYAMYHLSKGEFYDFNAKKKIKNNRFQWDMVQIALWGYSSVLTFFLFILSFLPPTGKGGTDGTSDPTYVTVMFAPLLIFWIWVVMQYKQYKWNWWRTTLVANAVFYSGSILFSIIVTTGDQGSSGFDIISTLQLFILFLSLYVFGKGQFVKSEKKSPKLITE